MCFCVDLLASLPPPYCIVKLRHCLDTYPQRWGLPWQDQLPPQPFGVSSRDLLLALALALGSILQLESSSNFRKVLFILALVQEAPLPVLQGQAKEMVKMKVKRG